MFPLPHLLLDLRDTGDTGCDRSLWTIIWACFLTLFACTWVAIHPDVPSAKDSGRNIVARRIGMMLCMLFVPEWVVAWSFSQWLHAVYYTDKLAVNHGKVEWTQTHSFFLIMGGFSYYNKDGGIPRILKKDELQNLYDEGLIEWPTVTLKEIQDHSKADFLSKFIVILQTTWFSLQLIVRLASGLAATELEISTFAFAILNIFVYALWWNKPFDVRSPIVIPGRYSPRPHCKTTINPLSVTPDSIPYSTPEVQNNDSTPFLASTITESIDPLEESHSDSKANPKSMLSDSSRFWIASLRACASFLHDTMIGFKVAFLYDAVTKEIVSAVKSKWSWWATGIAANSDIELGIIILVGVAFGVIHLIAWNFHFPTATEMWLWRSSSIALTASPILITGPLIMDSLGMDEGVVGFVNNLFYHVSLILYPVARIILNILPLIALRDPAPGVFVNINWTSLFPHF